MLTILRNLARNVQHGGECMNMYQTRSVYLSCKNERRNKIWALAKGARGILEENIVATTAAARGIGEM